jgi:23S rRNA pseudouridine1911/1915/1917 synthase
VVAARTQGAFDALARALKEGRLAKRYLVVCTEDGLPDEGTIEIGLANHPKDQRRVLACVHPRDVMRLAPRPASTRYRVEKRANGRALVAVWAPKALRHQIRAHFAAIEHPLLGDDLYGGEPLPEGSLRAGHALHACHVAHEHADARLSFDVTSPLPDELAALVA